MIKKRIQYAYLLSEAFVIKHIKHLFLGVLTGFFLTLFLLQVYPLLYNQFFGQKNYKIGIVGNFSENTLPLFLQNQISRGLTSLTVSGEASPSLAKAWEIDEKQTTYVFHLDNNVFWHDGAKFTARDINYKLKGAEFSVIDDYTLKVSLKEEYSPLPVILSRPIIRENLTGLGDYKVVKKTYSGETLTQIMLQSTVKGYPVLTYRIYSTNDDAVLGFKLGEVNMLYQLSSLGDLEKWNNIKITPITQFDRFVGIFYNLKNSLFKEKEIRQALAYAIPKFEEKELALTPISPLSWAYSNKIRLYKYDPEIAQKMLAKSPVSSSSTTLTITAYSSMINTAQAIVDAWKKVGVNSKIRVVSEIPDDYEILVVTQNIPPDPDQYQYWQSTQEGLNLTHYNSQKIDKLLEDGRKTTDKEKRIRIYADFQRYLVDDAPVNFLFYPKVYNVEKK